MTWKSNSIEEDKIKIFNMSYEKSYDRLTYCNMFYNTGLKVSDK